ncbi:MAG: glutathione ABC transporter permease GsiC [Caldibacillus debilis]|uniref:ABC-type dipeptide/oligopeptide/nickel transport system, permease component n=2 Tax=Caldibacillus debilis TaxID=301148 RepID=A0A420VG33_9BACI|nr:ABC transporter permease [Caldibacillus debilis]REJ25476.1 MAG: glutathione ABC transporter permease GsiC [Caldibacillus debilis]REJ27797.1 MAG: glutathione ABC transporter permease GsiC [Caldibacillus debilis]RKO62368.1 ABC-type dipeptide/oligopeptide/nickel transport system, permease component [Caldibacillus debilis GB1]
MGKYILKRLFDLVPTLFAVAIITFIITRIIPGDPASVMLGPQASVEDVKELREELGLNDPLHVQFFHYMKDLLTGDLGVSLTYNEPVIGLILERFPNTLILSFSALLIAILIGVPAGIIAAYKQNSLIDYAVMLVSLIGVSMPIFWLGVMLVLYFSVHLGWLPATGMGSPEDGMLSFLKYLILPSITLATIPMANFARITRSSMLEVISQEYIKTARAKGLSEFLVVCKHAFKNALTPILTVLGMQISMMLGGAVLTETIYSWPGMGRLIVDAIEKRDFVVVQGTVLFIAVIFILVNLLVDILYKVVNPKINYSAEKRGV